MLSLVPDPLRYFHAVLTPEKLRLSRKYLQSATIASDFRIIMKTDMAATRSDLEL